MVIANRWVHVYFTFFRLSLTLLFILSLSFLHLIWFRLFVSFFSLNRSIWIVCSVWIWIRVRCEVCSDKWNVFLKKNYLSRFYLYCSTSCFVKCRRKKRQRGRKRKETIEKERKNAIGRKYAWCNILCFTIY